MITLVARFQMPDDKLTRSLSDSPEEPHSIPSKIEASDPENTGASYHRLRVGKPGWSGQTDLSQVKCISKIFHEREPLPLEIACPLRFSRPTRSSPSLHLNPVRLGREGSYDPQTCPSWRTRLPISQAHLRFIKLVWKGTFARLSPPTVSVGADDSVGAYACQPAPYPSPAQPTHRTHHRVPQNPRDAHGPSQKPHKPLEFSPGKSKRRIRC